MKPRETYPPLNFHFVISFHNKEYKDSQFQSVQGLQARIEQKENNKVHTQFENIILKRAYQPDSKLVEWCMNALNNNKKEPQDLTIKLLSAKHKLVSAWIIEQAVPVGWGVEELHAQDAKVLLECIELSYAYFQVVNSKGIIVAPVPTEEE